MSQINNTFVLLSSFSFNNDEDAEDKEPVEDDENMTIELCSCYGLFLSLFSFSMIGGAFFGIGYLFYPESVYIIFFLGSCCLYFCCLCLHSV